MDAAHHDKPPRVQASILNSAGLEAIRRTKLFVYATAVHDAAGATVTPTESIHDLICLKNKFRWLCDPRTNLIMKRQKFFVCSQKPGEPVEAYINSLKHIASSCRFGDLCEELIRDRLACGVLNDKLRRDLLRASDLTINKAEQTCRIHKVTNAHSLSSTPQSALSIECISECNADQRTCLAGLEHNLSVNVPTVVALTAKREKCPAFGKICHGCNRGNYFWNCCRSHASKYETKLAVHLLQSESSHNVSDDTTVNIPENLPAADGINLNIHPA